MEDILQLKARCPNIIVTSNRHPVDGVPCVINDDQAVGRMGADYFLSKGYREFAFINADRLKFSSERADGFRGAVEAAGHSCDVFSANDQPEIPAMLARLLQLRGPVGLMAASDLHARWVIESLEDPMELIPRRIAVLGVDNDGLQNSISPLPISSVCLSGERIGYEAAEMGMRFARAESIPEQVLRIAPKYVRSRKSTDRIAVKDRSVARALRLMQTRMSELSDVNDLVGEIGISRSALEVKFKKQTGSTLAHELTAARISKARELLGSTDLPAKEIAFLVGFSEPRMLTLVIKRCTGELPSEFRARAQPGGTST